MKKINTKNISLLLVGFIVGIGICLYYFNKSEVKVTSKPSNKTSFFVTSKNKGSGADLGGLTGADAYCTSLAQEVGIKNKTWAAYLSTAPKNGEPVVNARERIGSGPWYNSKGERIASTLEELHTYSLINKTTALNEKGEVILGRGDTPNEHDILTGSDSFGNYVATTTDTTCSNWTSSSKGSAYVGHHDRIGVNESAPMKSWNSSHLTRGCDLPSLKATGGAGLYYCFAK